jgi:hypothetical protein
MATILLELIKSTKLDADLIAARTKQIHATVLGQSKFIDDPNFTSIHAEARQGQHRYRWPDDDHGWRPGP